MFNNNLIRVIALLLVVLQPSLKSAEAHGLLYDPPSRNWKAYVNEHYDYAHSLTAGGKYKVSNNCQYTWPQGQHGLCGDIAGQSRWMQPTAPKTYQSGQIIKIQIVVQTNHMGRFDFNLCPADATSEQQCKRLKRADGRGEFWYLPRIRAYNGGATGDAAVPTERGPISTWSWFNLPETKCKWPRQCDQFLGNTVYEVRYRLPAGFTCTRCVLQWHWLAGHNCWPPCVREDPTYPNCRAPTYQIPYCGSPGAGYPEEYWNCADIRITK